jgi:hypothetical protein
VRVAQLTQQNEQSRAELDRLLVRIAAKDSESQYLSKLQLDYDLLRKDMAGQFKEHQREVQQLQAERAKVLVELGEETRRREQLEGELEKAFVKQHRLEEDFKDKLLELDRRIDQDRSAFRASEDRLQTEIMTREAKICELERELRLQEDAYQEKLEVARREKGLCE